MGGAASRALVHIPQSYTDDPFFVSWFMRPPMDVHASQLEMLEKSMSIIRNLMDEKNLMYTNTKKFDEDGNVISETKKINEKALRQISSITFSLLNRVQGMPTQKIQLENLNKPAIAEVHAMDLKPEDFREELPPSTGVD